MVAPAPIFIDSEHKSLLARLGFLLVHTAAVYVCALFFAPRLVALGINTIGPFLHIEVSVPAGDWYLQHFAVVSFIPALVAGYINVRRPDSPATWAWIMPTLILAYGFVTYRSPSSALSEAFHLSAFSYFFDILPIMPTITNLFASDPIRLLAQLRVTAPFYAGIAYSLGAAASKRHLMTRLFGFRRIPT